jgi:serine/threonine-protein kinase
MAPEQAFSADSSDARSDLYSVGVMLYEMLSGARPASGDEAQTVAAKVHRGDIVPLVHAAPGVPRELAGLVHRAMAPRPELRFASASEMAAALRSVAQLGADHRGGGPPPAAMGNLSSTMLAPPIATPMPPGMGAVTGAAGKTAPPDAQLAASPGPPPYGYTPPPQVSYTGDSYGGDSYAQARRRRKSPIVWIIGVPLLVGAAAAAIVIGVQQSEPEPSPTSPFATTEPTSPPTFVPTPTITTPPGATAPTSPLPTLVPGQTPPTPRPSPRPTVDASASDAATHPAPPATPQTSPTPVFPPFPSTFPSTLPFPFPSNIPLPPGFPPIPSVFPFPPAAPPAPPKPEGASQP